MKRLTLTGSLAALLLASVLGAPHVQAAPVTASSAPGQAVLPAPGLDQVKARLGKMLGRHVLDRMITPVTKPLATRRSGSAPALTLTTRPSTSAPLAAQEQYADSSYAAGYVGNLGNQPAVGVAGTFNVLPVTSRTRFATIVGLGTLTNSHVPVSLQAGVDQNSQVAFFKVADGIATGVLPVHNGDQVTSAIAQWGAGAWIVVLVDQTTGQFFEQVLSFSPSTTLNVPVWAMYSSDPQPAYFGFFPPVSFSNAIWLSSTSANQQPLTSVPTLIQATMLMSPTGTIWPTEIVDPPGTGFSLWPCASCTS